MIFGDLQVSSSELQQMLRRDIGRRYTELNALGWLGRAWLIGAVAMTRTRLTEHAPASASASVPVPAPFSASEKCFVCL